MTRHRLEVADVFREHADEYLGKYGGTSAQRRVLRAVQNCRTAVLGGHVEACDRCGHERIAYNSCRNRHCPKCQGPATARWLEARAAELLPTPYFHLVFTLPAALGPLALHNPRLIYGLLLQAASRTLLEVAADPRHLGAEIGFLAVLHTWGQNLLHHPHVHCVIPAGGIAPDGSRWISCQPDFFLPVRVLSRVFRGKFVAGLKRAFAREELAFHGDLTELADPTRFAELLDQVVRHDWVVFAKQPFGGPRQVLKYLARYTHRVAIANRRLVSLREGRRDVPLERLRPQRSATADDARGHGVHPAFPAARAAERLHEDPALRIHGQSGANDQTRSMPPVVEHAVIASRDRGR